MPIDNTPLIQAAGILHVVWKFLHYMQYEDANAIIIFRFQFTHLHLFSNYFRVLNDNKQ